MNDLRFAFRQLLKNPGFTAVAVLTLALGIGANTAIFTLLNALLWTSPQGIRDPRGLVLVTDPGNSSLAYFAFPHYERLRDENRSFSDLFASAQVSARRLLVTGSAGETESVQAQAVSGSFLEVLGVRVACGRGLMASDDQLQDPQPVAVISYGYWQRRFGLDPAVIGRTITLDRVPFTIVGVTARGFSGFEIGKNPDLWWPIHSVPLVDGSNDALTSKGGTWVRLGGRLKPGATSEQASAELNLIYRRLLDAESVRWHLSEEQRQKRLEARIELQSGWAGWGELRPAFRRPLMILMALVSLVLLVACANLAGLLLARGAARHHELSLRLALGATRERVAGQLITESLLLAGAGGALGLLLAQWGVSVLAGYLPGYGQTLLLNLTPDLRILAFTFLVSALTGVLFGLVPAWRGSRVDLMIHLKDRTSPWVSRGPEQRWNKVFVVSQIALSGSLLVGAGLFVRTVQTLKSLDCGFTREHLLGFELLVEKEYSRAQRVNLCRQVLQRLESLPGVHCAGLSSTRSMTGADGGLGSWNVITEGAAPGAESGVEIKSVCVTPRYFQAMGIPLLRGREFLPQDESVMRPDGTSVPPVALIDETVARRFFGNGDPIGKRLRSLNRPMPPLEIIGVAKNARHSELRERSSPSLYILETEYKLEFLFFYVRTLGDPSAVTPSVRRVVQELEPTAEVAGLRAMSEVVNEQFFQERIISQVAGLFSVAALALACLGLYGTLSYGVVRRTHEIGVRMALGARIGNVLALVIRQGLTLAATGCALGLALATALTRLIASHLYGVTPLDPLTFVVVGLVLMSAALLACYLPARRASRIDPMEALRCE